MNLNAWLSYLETLHSKPIELGLDRITQVAKNLQLLPCEKIVITIGGTNGKGSCVALLEQIGLAAGYKVGAYTSPHLLKYNERIRINNTDVTDEALCEAFAQIDQIRGHITLTYFEFSTLAALLLFKQNDIDFLVLEVGMGGRLDAVNIVDPDIGLISTIALDHMEWLGPDRESIGREKAGIMRPHKPVICGDFNVPLSIKNHAQQIQAKLFIPEKDFSYHEQENSWSWSSQNQTINNLPLPRIELQNAASVLMAVELIQPKIPATAIVEGLRKVFVPGRFQKMDEKPERIFDVAHNPAAAALLAKQLQKTAKKGRTLAVIGMLKDKDQVGTVTPLLSQIDSWYVGGLNLPRGGSAKDLAAILTKEGAKQVHDYETVTSAYLAALKNANPEDRVIIFGSFYTVAEAMQVRL